MEVLLFYGASADHACKQGATALGISSQEGHEKCVMILLEYGANPHHCDHCGRTPIKLAMKSNNVAILRLLENYAKGLFCGTNRETTNQISVFVLGDMGNKLKPQQRAVATAIQSPLDKKLSSNVSLTQNRNNYVN